MNGLWNGTKYVTDADELKRECKFCGHCGATMREIDHPSPAFDRKTGRQGAIGSVHWECPNHGIGLDAMMGDWVRLGYENNPHDSVHLREKTA